MNIELVVTDEKFFETSRRDFDTMKEAREFVKYYLSKEYWNRSSETETGYKDCALISLFKNGECVQEWTPKWAK
jgi:hypothetical protein